MKNLKHLVYMASLFFTCIFLMPGFIWASHDLDNPYIKQVEIIQTERGAGRQSTTVKVILNSLDGSSEHRIDHIEFRDSNGRVYQFKPEEFHSTDSSEFYLKELPFLLPGGGINFTLYDVDSVEYEFPSRKGLDVNERSSTYDGTWTGTTDQGYEVSFIVSNDHLTQFKIKLTVYGTYCSATIETTLSGSFPISDNSFSISGYTPGTYGYSYSYTGTFTTNSVSNGTWDYTDFYCIASGSGTWNASRPDTAPPTVSSTTPADNAIDVAVNTSITATFSEAMDASTITTATFFVDDGSSNIAGTVTYSDTTAKFTPTTDLDYDTTYTATITIDAKDLAGNPLQDDYEWSFTTGSETVRGDGGGGGCFIGTAASEFRR
jgi:hypothetical protein